MKKIFLMSVIISSCFNSSSANSGSGTRSISAEDKKRANEIIEYLESHGEIIITSDDTKRKIEENASKLDEAEFLDKINRFKFFMNLTSFNSLSDSQKSEYVDKVARALLEEETKIKRELFNLSKKIWEKEDYLKYIFIELISCDKFNQSEEIVKILSEEGGFKANSIRNNLAPIFTKITSFTREKTEPISTLSSIFSGQDESVNNAKVSDMIPYILISPDLFDDLSDETKSIDDTFIKNIKDIIFAKYNIDINKIAPEISNQIIPIFREAFKNTRKIFINHLKPFVEEHVTFALDS